MVDPILNIQNLSVHAGSRCLVNGINLAVARNGVLGLIGPSGAGKSTILRCINRLAELTPGLKISGQIYFQGQPIYDSSVNADELRTKIGMLFQQPVIFPGSILSNVLFGVRELRTVPKSQEKAHAEAMLRQVTLWDEVKDRLSAPAQRLSVGQQQRLCLARTLALNPEMILMDEPTSALDPTATASIEQLIVELSRERTMILVTHDLQQAARICHQVNEIRVVGGVGSLT